MTFVIADQESLERLPDGTLITWERIPGDPTSRAVAFVNIERASEEYADEHPNDTDPVVWISTGGWSPQPPRDAGITYPAHVVVLGPLEAFLKSQVSSWPDGESSALDDFSSFSGGTYPRDEALRAVALLYQGLGHSTAISTVKAEAAELAAWLTGDIPAPQLPSDVLDPPR